VSTKLLPLVLHYLLDINCGVVVRETWVVEATGGHLEGEKTKKNKNKLPIHQERPLGEERNHGGRQSLGSGV
jgi:hypothetical protein